MATPVTVNTKSSINVVGGGTGTGSASFTTGSNEYAIVSCDGAVQIGSASFDAPASSIAVTYYVPPSTSFVQTALGHPCSWVIFANT
jgi:hypothetical protein